MTRPDKVCISVNGGKDQLIMAWCCGRASICSTRWLGERSSGAVVLVQSRCHDCGNLAWANFYDSADGQLARMTGQKTRLGRIGYTQKQECATPQFQHLLARLTEVYGAPSKAPQAFRDRFRQGSLPLMKWTNILTFNTRAIVLYTVCLLDVPVLYFVFEIVVMTALCLYMRAHHEALCKKLSATLS